MILDSVQAVLRKPAELFRIYASATGQLLPNQQRPYPRNKVAKSYDRKRQAIGWTRRLHGAHRCHGMSGVPIASLHATYGA